MKPEEIAGRVDVNGIHPVVRLEHARLSEVLTQHRMDWDREGDFIGCWCGEQMSYADWAKHVANTFYGIEKTP